MNGVVLLHSLKLEGGNSGYIYQDNEIMGQLPFNKRIFLNAIRLASSWGHAVLVVCATGPSVCTQTQLGCEQSDCTGGKMVSGYRL